MTRTLIKIIFCTLLGCSALAAELPPAPDPGSISMKVLPAGNHRDLVVRTCAVCHPPELVVAQRHTADKWDQIIARMVDHGAKATEDELDAIFDYLVKNFSTDGATATP
jgi:hypothetical protein